jgi:putative ABC transport system permease protein
LIFGIRLSVLFGLYRQRLANHLVSEFLASGGIAVGVALVFGVLVASGGILDSLRSDLHAVNGTASLALVARSADGFDQRLAQRAASLAGVQRVASLLRRSAVISGPAGSARVQLVGVTSGILALGGSATKDLGAGASLLAGGVGLPSSVAHAVGALSGATAKLSVGAVTSTVRVRAVLDTGVIGPLAAAPVVVSRLDRAQLLAGQSRRVNSVLLKVALGQRERVLRELRPLVGPAIDVVPADNELRLAQTAAGPVNQSTSLFVAVAAIVGFLLALNATLLTVPERRREIAEMRLQGFDIRQVLLILLFQASILGLVGSLLGIIVGALLAETLFGGVPGYLTEVFSVTGHQPIHPGTVAFALGCGLLASLLASLSAALDWRSRQAVDAVLRDPGEPGQSISLATTRRGALLGVGLVVLVGGAAMVNSSLTVAGGILLALAAICLIPLALHFSTHALQRLAWRYHGGMVAVTAIEMKATATRSVALAGVAALAVYGCVAIGGTRHDLLRGLDSAIEQEWMTAPVWVTPDSNIFDVDAFRLRGRSTRLKANQAIASVSSHQGSFLDLGTHRLWIRAIPPDSRMLVLSSQLLVGDTPSVTRRLRAGGWATISNGFAQEHHLTLGDVFSVPTPSGQARFAVAGITTNIGWPSGTLTINTSDYSRYWRTVDPTTLAIAFKPGVDPVSGRAIVQKVLADQPDLRVQSAQERIAEVKRIVHAGLRTLSQISSLLLLTAALALAAALWAAIYQRRARLASLKTQGFDHLQLWRSLLLESTVVLGIGCLDGVVLGIYGHALADRYVRMSVGFPAPFDFGGVQILLTLLLLLGIALAIILLPGYSVTGVSPRVSLQE